MQGRPAVIAITLADFWLSRALTAKPPPDQPAQREYLQHRDLEQVGIERLLAGLVAEQAAPRISPSVPPRKANSSKVDSAMRYCPRFALALSSPNAAKAMRLIAMMAAATLVGVRMWGELSAHINDRGRQADKN